MSKVREKWFHALTSSDELKLVYSHIKIYATHTAWTVIAHIQNGCHSAEKAFYSTHDIMFKLSNH